MAKIKLDLSGTSFDKQVSPSSPSIKLDLTGTSLAGGLAQKKNPNQSDTELSGVKTSTDTNQEEDGFWGSVKGFAVGALDAAKWLGNAALGLPKGIEQGAVTVGQGLITMGSAMKNPYENMPGIAVDDKYKLNLDQRMKFAGQVNEKLEGAKFEKAKGNANFISLDKSGVKISAVDGEAFGEALGDNILQFGLNALGPTGVMLNFAKNFEQTYQEARKQGIPPDRALVESAARGGIETYIEKKFGLESLMEKGLAQEGSKAAIKQITESVLTEKAFGKAAKEAIGLLNPRNIAAGFVKGFIPESAEEFVQTVADNGAQELFNYYEKSKNENIPEAKLDLYRNKDENGNDVPVEVWSKQTLVGGLNAAIYGGLMGQMGGTFINSRSWNPTIYSSLQNAYDGAGKQGLADSKVQLANGVKKALEKGTIDQAGHDAALRNLDLMEQNIATFDQNSEIPSYTRFQLFNIKNNVVPNQINQMASQFAEAVASKEKPTEDAINNDIENGNTSEFTVRGSIANAPSEFRQFINKEPVIENGETIFKGQVPNSLIQANENNQAQINSIAQEAASALSSLTDNERIVSVDDIKRLGQQGSPIFKDSRNQLAFEYAFQQNEKEFQRSARQINLLKSVAKDIETNKTPITKDEFQKKIENLYKFNTGDTIFFDNKSAKILEISNNGQKLKISGINEQVDASDPRIALEDEVVPQVQVAPQEGQEAPVEAPVAPQEEVKPLAEEEQITGRTMRDAVNELIPFTYKGETGEIYKQRNGVVVFESPNKIYEFGNINDIGDKSIDEFDIIPQEMEIGDDFSVTIDGKKFTNKSQNPFKAITYDAEGNAVSIKLDNDKGKTRVIKGARAMLIDAKYKIKQLFNDATRDQLAAAADDAARQAAATPETTGESGQTTTSTENKPVEQAPSIAEQERAARIREVAKKLVEQESPQTTENKQTIASLANSLFSSGIKVEVLSRDGIRAKYGEDVSQGMFLSKDGVVVINEDMLPSEWGKTVIFHEGTHPIINIIRNVEPKLYKQLVAAAREEAKTNPEVNKIFQQIKNSAAYGDEFTRNDELVVEMIARVASGKLNLNDVKPSLKQAFVDFVNKIAKMMGLKPILSDSDQVAFSRLATQISNTLNAGRDIAEIVGAENVAKFAIASNVDTEGENSAIYGGGIQQSEIERAKVSEKPVINVYKTEGVSELPVRSLKDIYDSYGGKVVFINSDPTKVGNLKLVSGKEIFLYGGPEYMSLTKNVEGNVGFATTLESKVKTHDKLRNNVFGDKKGVTIVATQSPDSIMSNSYSLRYILDAITQLPKKITSDPRFKKEFFGEDIKALQLAFGTEAYDTFLKKFKDTDFNSAESIGVMIDELGYKLSSVSTPASFKARKALTNNLVAGFVTKSSRVDTRDEKGFVSVSPKKFIAKSLFDEFGVNAESIIKQIGNKDIVDKFFNEGIWGLAVSGFETLPESNYASIQDKGVEHPLFNAKFYGENPFKLDAAYKVDDIILPVQILDKSNNPYIKKTSLMLSTSIYVGGDIEAQLSDIDRTYSPETTVADAGMTMAERETWRANNKVSQKQKRVPIVMQASRDLYNGNITFDDYVKVVRDNMAIVPFSNVPKIPSLKEIISSLNEDKLNSGGIVGVNRSFKDGERVASRLDIPAYENYDTWVVSIHDSAKERILGYSQTAVLKNVQFKTSPKIGLSIAANATFLNDMDKEGKGKATIARIHGDWVNESPESAHKRATELMEDPSWTQVGMNPFRHSFFYDKATGEALTSADEVIQIGALVLAKNVVKAPFGSQAFIDNFSMKNKFGETIQFSDMSRDDKRIQFVRNNINNYTKSELTEGLMQAFDMSREAAERIVAQATADPLAPSIPQDNPDTSIPKGAKLNQKSATTEKYNSGYDKAKKALLEKAGVSWDAMKKYIAEQYDSKFFGRRKLGQASSQESLAQSRLRNLNGIAYSAGQDLAVIYNDIFGNGLEAEGERTLNAMIFNLRILQVDVNTEAKYRDEIEKLTLEFANQNNRLPNTIESMSIQRQARVNVPVKKHGKTLDGSVDATSATAQAYLDALRVELGESEYNMLKTRAEMYRKVGNEQVAKLQAAGIISKEVADSFKDDFYSYRKTLDRLYGEQDMSITMLSGVASIKGWASLSKTGTENYLEQDARLLLAESYIGTARAIAKNKLREAIYEENIKVDANGKESSVIDKNGNKITFIKPAVYIRDKDGNIRSNNKQLSVRDAEEGYVNVPYKKDGVINYFQMEREMFDQIEGNNIRWNDAEASGSISNAYYSITDFSNRILTGMATRKNPFFWIGNVPMDLQQQVFFSDIWTQGNALQSNVYSAGARAFARTIKFSNFFGRNKDFVDQTLAEFIAAGGAMDRMSTMKEQRQRSIKIALNEGEKNSRGQMIKKKASAFFFGLNERTELAMRLAAYDQAKNNLIKKFKEENNTAPSESDMLKIQEIAASQARGYTDFAQRGTDLPNLNIAYLNSSIQAAGSALEYSVDNPGKIASKLSQLAIGKFAGTIAIMALMGDAYDDLDEYTKDLYSFLYAFDTGLKDGNGKPVMVTADVKNNPSLVPFMGVTRTFAEMTMRHLQGKEQKEITAQGSADRFFELANIALPVPVMNVTSVEGIKEGGLKLITKHTLINAAVKAYGYDAFKGKNVVSVADESLSPYMQGMNDKNVPYFYKAIARSMANNTSANQISPAKMQAVAETFITSPATNGFVGIAYGVLSSLANAIVPAESETQRGDYAIGDASRVIKSVTKRFASFTDSEKTEFRKNEELYKMSKEEAMKYNDIDRNIDVKLKELHKQDPANFFNNVDKYAKEKGYFDNINLMDRIDRKADLIDKNEYNRSFINENIANEVKILHFTPGAEGKAKLLKYMFDKDATKARQVIDGMIDYGTSSKEAYDAEDLYLKSIK